MGISDTRRGKLKPSTKILMFVIVSFLILSGFIYYNSENGASADLEVTKEDISKKLIPEAKVLKEPTKHMWESALKASESVTKTSEGQMTLNNIENEEIQKWIIRVIMEKEVSGEKIDVYEAQKMAVEKIMYENAWLNVALENYGITYTQEEVDTWIKNGPGKYPLQEMYIQAEALNLTFEELIYDYDRDFYVKWVVWDKLYPILAEKYNVDLNAESQPNTLLVNYYDLEVKNFLAENK